MIVLISIIKTLISPKIQINVLIPTIKTLVSPL